MTRTEAYELLCKHIQEQNLIKHCLATEAGMLGLADVLNENENKINWGLAGLLHDIDYEYTKNNPELHSLKSLKILKPLGINQEILDAIETHNEIHKKEPISKMAKSLFCLDPLTGLIVASTLVLPSKQIKDLTVENIINRFKEKSFAKGANREHILRSEQYLNISLRDFISIVLQSMQNINTDLGL